MLKRAQQMYSNLMQQKVALQSNTTSKPAPRATPTAHVPKPSGPQYVPMDIDASKANTGNDPRKCYNCNEVGHISRNCPKPRKPRQTRATLTDGTAATVAASSTTAPATGNDPASMQSQIDRLERLCATLADQNKGLLERLKAQEEEGSQQNF